MCECGAVSWVMRSTEDPRLLRISCNKCHNRWCEACAGEKRRKITFALRDHLLTLKGTPIRCLTLTLKTTDHPLKDELDRLYESFRKFRSRPKIAACLQGGIAFLELTYSSKTEGWHPHLHVLFIGDFLPQQVAAHEWHMITQDSYIVDVRAVKDDAAVGYVAKYLGKAVPANVYHSPDLLQEVMRALDHRRTFTTFGTWRGLHLLDPETTADGWTCIGSLSNFLALAASGDPDAARVIAALRREPRETLDLPHPNSS